MALKYLKTPLFFLFQHKIIRKHFSLDNYRIFDEKIVIDWSNNTKTSMPFSLIRDLCRCDKCFHASSGQRLFYFYEKFANNSKPISIKKEDNNLIFEWYPDKHNVVIPIELLQNLPKKTNSISYPDNKMTNKKLWNEKTFSLNSFNYNEMLNAKKTLQNWVEDLYMYGANKIVNCPTEAGVLRNIEKLLGYIRKTNYGEIFTVKIKKNANNLAYTSGFLPLHTDLPYYKYVPGIQLLHFIQQSQKGGENLLIDGFNLAYLMKEEFRKSYEVLTSVDCLYTNVGTDIYGSYYLSHQSPLIELKNDQVNIIREGNFQRKCFIGTSEEIGNAYKSYKLLHELMQLNNGQAVSIRMENGEILCLDNTRVLHGRLPYHPDDERHVEGCYFDWDVVLSRSRTL